LKFRYDSASSFSQEHYPCSDLSRLFLQRSYVVMFIGVHHIGLRADDSDEVPWLSHVCSAPKGAWKVAPNVRIRLENTQKVVSAQCKPRPVNLPGIAHICLQSRDIDKGLALGVKAGLTPISGPVDLGTPFRYLYAHTMDGVLLELEGAPFVRDGEPYFWVGHVAYVARDIVPLVDFYARVLGLKASAISRLRGNPAIDQVAGLHEVDLSAMWLPGFNLGLEFWQYHNPRCPLDITEPATGFTHICFESDDFEGDCAHVLAQGAAPDAPLDLDIANSKSAAFKDPEGNRFMLIAFDDLNDPNAVSRLPHKDILARVAAQLP
jgi:catechol 2,3-dioxygenase-like lactoylglutathione lyase family enzyme